MARSYGIDVYAIGVGDVVDSQQEVSLGEKYLNYRSQRQRQPWCCSVLLLHLPFERIQGRDAQYHGGEWKARSHVVYSQRAQHVRSKCNWALSSH